jgi:peroxiredoxin
MNGLKKLLPMVFLVILLAAGCSSPSASQTPPATVPLTISSTTSLTPTAQTTSQVPTGISVGNRAIDFQLQTVDGKTVSLSALRGSPVLLNFWATWCPPCKLEMPFLQQIFDIWTARGLVLLTVDAGENADTIKSFMTDLNLSMPVLMDADGKVAKAYSITAIPTTFFIDNEGVIQHKTIGAFPNKEAIETNLALIVP